MGCLMSKKPKYDKERHNQSANRGSVVGVSSKEYSWSNRDRRDLSRYTIENVTDRVEMRLPGEIEGQQFIIQNCARATICLYDYANTVMIDDCIGCTFFIGPVMGSIAVRNCDDCHLMSASQQFRTRDCKRLDLFLFCATQPAIESCTQLRFGCFSANYAGLKDQFTRAGLNVFNNKWSQVYDFSIDDQERHWNTFPAEVRASDYFRSILMGNPVLNLSFNSSSSLVPQTAGVTSMEFMHKAQSADFYPNSSASFESTNLPTLGSLDESSRLCLIFLFGCDQQTDSIDLGVERLIQEVNLKHKDLSLLMTKSFPPEQVNLKLSLINETDSGANKGEDGTSTKPPDRLLVLFYQGNESTSQILIDFCNRIFGTPQSALNYKIVTDEHEENNFAHYLSITFENLISY